MSYKDLPPFISTTDLEAFLGTTLADPTALIVKIALDSACDAVRSYLGQDINLVTDDEEYHSGHGWLHDRIRLRQRPVVSVTSVTDYGDPVDASRYHVRDSFVVLTDYSYFLAGNDNIKITYTHGWSAPATSDSPSVPADLRLVALSAARRVWSTMGTSDMINKRGEKIGDYEYTYGFTGSKPGQIATSAAELLAAEKDVLDRYRIGLVP